MDSKTLEIVSRKDYGYGDFWSMVKGIGIISVVIGHSDVVRYLVEFVFLYHIVLFYFAAGFHYNKKYSAKEYIWRRIKSMYVPFITYGIIFVLLHNIFFRLGIETLKETHLYDMHDTGMALFRVLRFSIPELLLIPSWFIPSLFVSLIIYDLLRRGMDFLIKDKDKCIILFSLLLFFLSVIGVYMFRTDIRLSFHAHISLLALPILLVANLCNEYKNKIPIALPYIILSLIIFFTAFHSHVRVDLAMSTLPFFRIFYFVSFVGLYLVLGLVSYLRQVKWVANWLTIVGRNSLHIMMLHFFFFYLLIFCVKKLISSEILTLSQLGHFLLDHGTLYVTLQVIVGIVFPLVTIFLFRKCKGLILPIINNITIKDELGTR